MEEQKSATVQAFICRDQDGKILLVHEKEEGVLVEDPDGINRPRRRNNNGKRNKPSAWALPGGGVELRPPLEALGQKLIEFICVYKIAPDQETAQVELANAIPEGVGSEDEARFVLELIRECLLETGFLVRPVRRLFDHPNDSGHTVYVFHCQVVAGQLQRTSVETDDCRWFGLSELPADLFHSHSVRINKAASILGLNADVEEMGGVL